LAKRGNETCTKSETSEKKAVESDEDKKTNQHFAWKKSKPQTLNDNVRRFSETEKS